MAESFVMAGLVVSSCLLTDLICEKIRINKISKYEGCIIIDSNEIRKAINNIDNEVIKIRNQKLKVNKCLINKKRINKDVLPLVDKLKENIDPKNLTILNHNIKNLKLSRDLTLLLLGASGSYTASKNEITYANKKTIGHEVIHAASSIILKNGISVGGFRQRKGFVFLGKGIQEGYTELLASRIYNKNNKPTCYKYLVKVARLLELFFDDPKELEQMYFNCDLSALISKLELFSDRQQIIKIFTKLDTLASSNVEPLYVLRKISIFLEIYNLFLKTNPSEEKINKMQAIMSESLILKFVLKCKNFRMNKKSPYDNKVMSEVDKSKTLNKIRK